MYVKNDIDYLSYSGFKYHQSCPLAYWFRYVNQTPSPPENVVGSLYGSVVGVIFEAFYRDSLFLQKNYIDIMLGMVEGCLDKDIADKKKKGGVVDFAYMYPGAEAPLYRDRNALVADIKESIPRGVASIKQHRLLGTTNYAEWKLDHRFGKYLLGGRADFAFNRTKPNSDWVIVDGKGSKHRAKYVDGHASTPFGLEGSQLKWYAALFREKMGRLPDKLGYLFWKFAGAEAIEWLPFTADEVDSLLHEVLSVVGRIDRSASQLRELDGKPRAHEDLLQELFPAQPGHGCTLCAYCTICSAGRKEVRPTRPEVANLTGDYIFLGDLR
jgi:hypothetical protein